MTPSISHRTSPTLYAKATRRFEFSQQGTRRSYEGITTSCEEYDHLEVLRECSLLEGDKTLTGKLQKIQGLFSILYFQTDISLFRCPEAAHFKFMLYFLKATFQLLQFDCFRWNLDAIAIQV